MAKENASTQEILDIKEIKNNTVVLNSGGLRKIVLTSGENFDLRSEEEQNLLIYSYQDFLNSLNFSIQIIVHSRKVNIEGYLRLVKSRSEQEQSALLKNIIIDYHKFIGDFISKNPIMSKTFFIVVPYDPVTITTKQVLGIFKRKKTAAQSKEDQERNFSENIKQLDLRIDRVIAGLNRIGLRAVPLEEAEIVELFYNFYNPSTIEKKNIEIK